MPIIVVEKLSLNEDEVFMLCSDIDEKFESFLVKTTMQCIQKTFKTALKKHKSMQEHIKRSTYRELTKYTKCQLIKIFNEQSKDWQNWCDDVLLYYIYRLVIDGEALPIVKASDLNK